MNQIPTNEANIFDVANYIIKKSSKIPNMKLQKLIYYAHAFHLVLQNEKLVDEVLQAWLYGPVFPKLYQEFCQYSYRFLKPTPKGDLNNLSLNHMETINLVLRKFGHIDTGDLCDQTHDEDPWLDAHRKSNDWEQCVITDRSLKRYFAKTIYLKEYFKNQRRPKL